MATRELESTESSFEIKVGQPEKVDANEWRCAYSVADKLNYAHGLDAFQALVMAITGVRIALDNMGSPIRLRGAKTGDHGVPRMVPQALGVAFSRKIEELIDAEVTQFLAKAESAARARSEG
jgi:hypothetical protein